MLNEILEDMGFGGLWRSCSLNFAQEQDKQCFILTEKLIEVRVVTMCLPPALRALPPSLSSPQSPPNRP
jgi:hypothetical protein